MKPEENYLRFFLGANTPQGFVSRFDQLADVEDGWRLMVIKGGPGSGKSTMMKHIAQHFAKQKEPVELIHCSSDVDSIDGVILPGVKVALADGTRPHAIEPQYPGVFEHLIDLTACWDSSLLYAHRDAVISLSRSCSRCHEHCCRFLSAAGSLSGDTYRIALECVNTTKLAGYITRLTDRELKLFKKDPGKESVRFLNAVTNKGTVCFDQTANLLCERIYLIQDDYGAVSRLLLNALRAKALSAGYDIISCYCPLAPFDKLEQLFIPSLRLGFMTSNFFHDFGARIDPYRIVNSQRFQDADTLKSSKKRIQFNRKAIVRMLDQAQLLLKDAKNIHDELESYYVHATDFDKVEALTANVLDSIVRLQ